MRYKGKFIVIEGSDGSGKATQLELLKKRITKETKRKVIKFDFPQYQTFFGKLVGRYLAGEFGGIKEVNPYFTSLTYALDRWAVKPKIEKYLSEGKVILSNRYYLSNMAHQTARMPEKKWKEFMKFLEELELVQLGIPKDDITVYLYVPPKISQILVDKKEKRTYTKGKRDLHEANLRHLETASKIYERLQKKYKRIIRINCCDKKGILKPVEEIHKEIWDKLKTKFR